MAVKVEPRHSLGVVCSRSIDQVHTNFAHAFTYTEIGLGSLLCTTSERRSRMQEQDSSKDVDGVVVFRKALVHPSGVP